jgi:hypothetical protein
MTNLDLNPHGLGNVRANARASALSGFYAPPVDRIDAIEIFLHYLSNDFDELLADICGGCLLFRNLVGLCKRLPRESSNIGNIPKLLT